LPETSSPPARTQQRGKREFRELRERESIKEKRESGRVRMNEKTGHPSFILSPEPVRFA